MGPEIGWGPFGVSLPIVGTLNTTRRAEEDLLYPLCNTMDPWMWLQAGFSSVFACVQAPEMPDCTTQIHTSPGFQPPMFYWSVVPRVFHQIQKPSEPSNGSKCFNRASIFWSSKMLKAKLAELLRYSFPTRPRGWAGAPPPASLVACYGSSGESRAMTKRRNTWPQNVWSWFPCSESWYLLTCSMIRLIQFFVKYIGEILKYIYI